MNTDDPKLPVLPDGLPPNRPYQNTLGPTSHELQVEYERDRHDVKHAEAVPLGGAPLAAGEAAETITNLAESLPAAQTLPESLTQPAPPREWDEMKRVLKRIEGTVTIFGLGVQQTDQWWTGYHECLKDVRRMIEDVVREVPAQVAVDVAELARWALIGAGKLAQLGHHDIAGEIIKAATVVTKAAALKAGEGAKGMSDDPVKLEDCCWHGSGRDYCRKKPVFRLIGGHGCALCEEHAASVKPEMLERIEEQPEPK